MAKRRRLFYRRRRRGADEIGADGQDSFLDVVSNLVGILIILVMVAGSRVRDAAVASSNAAEEVASAADAANESEKGLASERAEYVAAVESLEDLRAKVEKFHSDAEELGAQTELVESGADAAEEEYRRLLEGIAGVDAALDLAARERSDAERIAFDLKSELFEKEKKRDDLRRETEALEAARPGATLLENLPTPISQRVEDGREGFFRLKNGRLSHVPLNEFQERVRLAFKNFRGDLSQKEHEESLGPVENYMFHYFVDVESARSSDEIQYMFVFRYGECLPQSDLIGEPVDDALSNPDSVFRQKLQKYVREDTTITIFVYPDSFQYLRDVKKFVLSLEYRLALRPLPDGAPIAVSPDGTASSTY